MDKMILKIFSNRNYSVILFYGSRTINSCMLFIFSIQKCRITMVGKELWRPSNTFPYSQISVTYVLAFL